MKKNILFLLIILLAGRLSAQRVINFEDAMHIARESSPSIRQARLNLERNQELLNAQEATLKSHFSLNVSPYTFSRDRTFNPELSRFNSVEQQSTGGTFLVSQPVLLTDATFTFSNSLNWFNSKNTYNVQGNGGAVTSFSTETKSFTNRLSVSLDQPLFTYNRTKLALENVKNDLDNAYLRYVISELQLEQQVAQVFYRAYQNKLALQVAREDLNNTQQSHDIIKNKVNAGLAAQEELYQAELNLITSRSAQQNAEVTLQNSLDDLKQVIGIDLSEDISVVAEIEQSKVKIDMQRAIELGLANRLELRQRKLDILQSRASLVQAGATNEFKGNMRLSYGFTGNDENFNKLFQKPDESQDINLSFDIPIYDWGEQESREKAARASVSTSEQNLEDQKINIIIGIRKTYRSLENQALQIDLAKQNVKIAQQTYDINLERYENGDLTSMDLNLFQNQLSTKKNSLIDAMINYKLLLLDMKVQALWDFENDQPVDTGINPQDKDMNKGEEN